MKNTMTSAAHLGLFILFALVSWLFSATLVLAQSAGNNTVFNGTGNVPSTSLVDVSAATTTSTGDICARINFALLNSLTVSSTIVDARGIVPASGNSQNCTSDPFAGFPPASNPSRSVQLLLPAGTIVIFKAWAIPSQTQVIGEGVARTILQATTSSFTDTYASPDSAMLHMGTPSKGGGSAGGIVFQIRIEHLSLDAQNQSIDGIDNQNAEEMSYVNDVAINNVGGIGLLLGLDPLGSGNGAADHSGPYTNIIFQTSAATTTTECINVQYSEPRGLHGITCIANGNSNGGILIDGGNVSVEDVRIDGFTDGIRIGSQTGGADTGQTDVLMNIVGTDTVNIGGTTNLIHIYNTSTGNISIVGATCAGTSTACLSGNTSILDKLTNTSLTDGHIAMYALGQAVSGGYSRFTTSPNIPAWASGASAPSGTCTTNGSLFSNVKGSSGTTLYACINNGTSTSWTAVK